MFGRRFVVTEILPERITVTHPVHDWVFVGRRRISVSDFRSPPANTQYRNAVPVHVLIPHPSVDAFIGSNSLMLSSPASTTLIVRPNERANSPSYRIAVRAYDATGRLVKTTGYDLSLFSNRPVGFATHRTVYRNAWAPQKIFGILVSPSHIEVRYHFISERGFIIGVTPKARPNTLTLSISRPDGFTEPVSLTAERLGGYNHRGKFIEYVSFSFNPQTTTGTTSTVTVNARWSEYITTMRSGIHTAKIYAQAGNVKTSFNVTVCIRFPVLLFPGS
jgi:hypothetical protein